jgi:hypothetical protein
VSIRAKGDGHAALERHPQQLRVRINLATLLAQTGRVQLDRRPRSCGRVEEGLVERSTIFLRPDVEFFREVRMPDDVEQAGRRRRRQQLEITLPNFKRVMLAPARNRLGIINGPIRNVVDGPDEEIPVMTLRQFADPALVTGNVIHFEADQEVDFGHLAAGLFHGGHVITQLALVHPPVVEIIARHR